MNNQPVCEIDADGNKEWFLNGEYHREDGPAIEFANGNKAWYLHGKYHREDGPAFEGTSGWHRWYLENEEVEPETLVDLWLSRGVFCYFDDQEQELKFGEKQ